MTTKNDLQHHLESALQEISQESVRPNQEKSVRPNQRDVRDGSVQQSVRSREDAWTEVEPRPSGSRGLVIGIAVMMFVVIFVVVGWKKYFNNDYNFARIFPSEHSTRSHYPPQSSSSKISQLRSTVAALRSDLNELKTAAAKSDLRSRQNREKIQVIGIVTNENTIIARNGYPRQYYMLITRKWKLARAPRYIRISEADRKYIEALIDGQKGGDGVLLNVIPGEPNDLPVPPLR